MSTKDNGNPYSIGSHHWTGLSKLIEESARSAERFSARAAGSTTGTERTSRNDSKRSWRSCKPPSAS